MEWSDVSSSSLATSLAAGTLRHPTNAGFDATQWRAAFRSLKDVSQRDADLVLAAVTYGRRLQAVRADEVLIPTPPSQSRSLRLLAACANHQALTVLDKSIADRRAQIAEADETHFEQLNQRLLKGAPGQSFTAEDLNTIVIDSLPHWLHRIAQLPLESPLPESQRAAGTGSAAFLAASLTTSLRTLWQGVLWLGHGIDRDGEVLRDVARDQLLAEQWFIWDMRRTALAQAAPLRDIGLALAAPERLKPVTPISDRTVVAVKRGKGGRRLFLIGPADPDHPGQRSHATELRTLERLYIGQFLDELLPLPEGLDLTCRELNAAWCVLTDMARLVVRDLGRRVETDRDIGLMAFPIDLPDLSTVFQDALAVGPERALAILALLTCDIADVGALFARGVWASPLLADPSSDRHYLLLGALLLGSPTRRIEAFMVRGGIADSGGVKSRGKPFEARVRRTLAETLRDNPALPDAAVHPDALARRAGGEEIDLLIRVGSIVLIGEIKCLVAPSEALEKHNYLRALGAATAQATTKLQWAEGHRDQVAALFAIEDAAVVEGLQFLPLVVLNQGMGCGLSRNGVPIVDFHYLSLLLGSTHYRGQERFEHGAEIAHEQVSLYRDQADFEALIFERLADPVVLQRYRGVTGWRRTPVYWDDLEVELPTLTGNPAGPRAAVKRAAGPPRF